MAGAYRVRAELVGNDDLRPPELPEPMPPRRHRLLTTLVVAAVAAVLAVPFVRGGATPAPEEPAERVRHGGVELDVNGDAATDVATLDFDATVRVWTVTVEVSGGRTLRFQGLAGQRPVLVGAVDLDEDFADEIAILTSDRPDALPEFLRYVEGNLRRLRTPPTAREVNGWEMSSGLNRWALERGRLYSWRFDPQRSDELQRTGLWRWEVEGEDRLVPGRPRAACVSAADDFPRDCLTLVPTAQTEVVEADLDGDGVDDRVTLSYEATLDDQWVYHYDLVVDFAGGGRDSVRTGEGGRPRLWDPVSIGAGAGEQVLVERGGSEARPLLVYGLVDGELRRLRAPDRPWLGTGPVGNGPDVEVGVDGSRLVSYRLLEGRLGRTPRSRVEAYEWRVSGAELRPVLLRGYCVDPRSGEFPASC